MPFFSYVKKWDWVLIGAAVLLAAFGIVELIGMAQNDSAMSVYAEKQAIALVFGVLLMGVVSFFDYRFFRNSPWAVILLYVLSLGLLATLLVVGVKAKGSTAWFRIGEFAFGPVEVVKIALVLLFAKFFSPRHIEMYRFSHLLVSILYVAAPCVLVLLQPDLGSASVLAMLWLAMLFLSGIPWKRIILLCLTATLVLSVAWAYGLKEYQKDRIMTFINPYQDPQGAGYNAIQSVIAVGDGGIFGAGLGYGSQIQLGFLPQPHTDFMFASITEEFGAVGAAIVFLLLCAILWRITSIAFHADNNFARLLCAGMVFLIFIQVVINMGMNIGLAPVIGIPFPFLSYGGSSLISFFLGLGLVQSIRVRELA